MTVDNEQVTHLYNILSKFGNQKVYFPLKQSATPSSNTSSNCSKVYLSVSGNQKMVVTHNTTFHPP